MFDKTTVLLHLTLIKGIGPVTINGLLARISPETPLHDIYTWQESDFVDHGMQVRFARLLVQGLQDTSLVDEEMRRISVHNIKIITIFDDAYPLLLRETPAPPPIVYIQGTFTIAQSIAVIGSRDATQYAQRAVDVFVPWLVEHGLTIVSGGARGVDGMAHHAALQAGGATIVVLGSGLLQWYPREHSSLFNKILDAGGSIISHFPSNEPPLAGNFPARNRVIAGLSQGCLVVQAAHESGARITAQYALDYGRSVYAIPGMFDDPLSVGCHDLITEGARLVTHPNTILEDLNMVVGDPLKEKFVLSSPKMQTKTLDPLLELCREPIEFDNIVLQSGLSADVVRSKLCDLMLAGLVNQDFMGRWITSH